MPLISPLTIRNTVVKIPTGLFINNRWVDSVDHTHPPLLVLNPATGERLLEVTGASSADVDLAVTSARRAFKTTWGTNVPAVERGRLLHRLADLIHRDTEVLALIESVDSGKGVRMARADIQGVISCLRYFAGWSDKITGQTIEVDATKKFIYTVQEPIGVCGQIIPWNYPLGMWGWKVGPALAAGCTIVMKPSELTPLSALYVSNLVHEAGFPDGVFNTLPGLGSITGSAISKHLKIDKIAFTGSVETGRTIMEASARSNLKKVTLELGGKSPSIVCASADVVEATKWAANGVFYNSGQDCTAGSRIFVHESIYDEYIEELTKRAKEAAIGDPLDEETSFGPLISEQQLNKVLGYIQSGVDEGATLVVGGKRPTNVALGGYFLDATVLKDVTSEMKCVREEIFGPVTCVFKWSDENEVVELANDTSYGLAAGVFTNDVRQSWRLSRLLEAGTVWVNSYSYVYDNVPFGGYKQSGLGRELGPHGILEYTTTKSVHNNIADVPSWPV